VEPGSLTMQVSVPNSRIPEGDSEPTLSPLCKTGAVGGVGSGSPNKKALAATCPSRTGAGRRSVMIGTGSPE